MENNGKRRVSWTRGAAAVICLCAGALGVWLAFRYALGVALPFLLAWLLSKAIKPLIDRICARVKLPRGVVSGTLVVLLVGGVVWLAAAGIRRGIDELSRLIGDISADSEGIVAAVERLFERANSISAHLPFLRRFEDAPGYADFCARLDATVADGIDRLVTTVGARLPGAAMAVAGWLPGAFLFVTVLLLACYYFCADDGALGRGITVAASRLLPEAWQDALPPLGRRLRRLGRQYARAYLILGLFTFLLVFIGLSLLRVPYAFILAWVIALVDLLPLLGTGVVLVPWAAVSLLLGETVLGIGLLVLFLVCTLVRQIAEPRMLGQELGLHPLLSLAAMYVGLRLFGFWGMLLAPLLTAGVKSVVMGE